MNYFDVPALSASLAKQLVRSAAHGKAYMDAPKKPTASMQFGTAVHAVILEPEKSAFVIRPDDLDRRTKEGKLHYAELEASGLPILTSQEAYAVMRIRDNILSIPAIEIALRSGKTEVEHYWDGRDVKCKAKADLVDGSTIYDIKTTQDASCYGFRKAIRQYQYGLQARHYLDGFGAERFIFIAVETEPPYAVGLYELTHRTLEEAGDWLAIAAERYCVGMSEGRWPGYSEAVWPIGD